MGQPSAASVSGLTPNINGRLWETFSSFTVRSYMHMNTRVGRKCLFFFSKFRLLQTRGEILLIHSIRGFLPKIQLILTFLDREHVDWKFFLITFFFTFQQITNKLLKLEK